MRRTLALGLILMSTNTFAVGIADMIQAFSSTYAEPAVSDASLPKKRPPSLHNIFMFDPQHHSWAVYNKDGERVGLGRASGGANYCKDIHAPCRTVEGEYTVFRKEDADCTSKTFPIDEGGGAPMPHCMFFYKGYAIHGSNYVMNANRSHGCIRITQKAAEWVSDHYINPGSLVIVLPYRNEARA